MKRKNDNTLKNGREEGLEIIDERMQLLETFRQMIGIEFERHGVKTEGSPHPESTGREPPDRKPPRRTL